MDSNIIKGPDLFAVIFVVNGFYWTPKVEA